MIAGQSVAVQRAAVVEPLNASQMIDKAGSDSVRRGWILSGIKSGGGSIQVGCRAAPRSVCERCQKRLRIKDIRKTAPRYGFGESRCHADAPPRSSQNAAGPQP